ncbi:MAG: hypothetical protein EAZ30_13150 [Betaproteobacteria bacterium]|nr:MAG: hypothetical protein EAZ30_13150 [Betaproteobacteria bacterium]
MNPIEFSIVPAKDGFEWVKVSLRLFRAQWLRYTSMAALFLLIMQFGSFISGGLLVVFLKPLLSVGFLAAAWHHERGELPETKHLFAGFKSNIKALLPLGVVFMLGVFAAIWFAAAINGIELEQMLPQDGKTKLAEKDALAFMLTAIIFTLPVNAALWFAPALIVFSDASFTQALSTSLRAWLSNFLAVLTYGITIFVLILIVLIPLSPILYAVGGSAQSLIAMLVALPLTAVVMVSDYVSYRRVFHRNETLQPLSTQR